MKHTWGGPSPLFAALRLARTHLDAFQTVLVVGTGEIGELAVKRLAHMGTVRLIVFSHSRERAETLAARYQAESIGSDRLPQAVQSADLIIACSGTPGILITPTLAARALGRRLQVYVDLSVPRCIDPGVSNLPGVRLFNVDDLASTPTEQRRTGDLARAWAIVEEETQAFLNWMRERRVAPTITRLRRRAERIRRLELQKTLRHLRTLSERERQLIERLSMAIVNKILHEPTVRLKHNALQGDGALLAAMERLFGLNGSPRE